MNQSQEIFLKHFEILALNAFQRNFYRLISRYDFPSRGGRASFLTPFLPAKCRMSANVANS